MSTRSHPESARIIREARQAAGLTQLELAEKLGVTIGTIGYYERGAGMPKTDNLPPTSCAPIHKPDAPASVSASGGVAAGKRPSSLFRERAAFIL